jgi:hypothetical protein
MKMREILFRGKTRDNEWAQGSLHIEYGETTQDGNREIDYRILGMRGECRYVIPKTVGQYTGKMDKNGTKIFEGDIIRGLMDYGPAGWLERIVSIGWNAECGYQWNYFLLDTIEVIGNIHDNPELLGGNYCG